MEDLHSTVDRMTTAPTDADSASIRPELASPLNVETVVPTFCMVTLTSDITKERMLDVAKIRIP